MQKLNELIAGNDLIVAPVALNPIMARLAEEAGFKAIYLSGGSLGWLKCVTEANLTLPELADPGYRGEMKSLVREMHFQYTGWLRAQKIVPVTSLKVGTNDVLVLSGATTSTSAIRATQIQLKYLWDKSDYQLRTGQ